MKWLYRLAGIVYELAVIVIFRWIFFLPFVIDRLVNFDCELADDTGRPPVFLVHGFMQTRYNFWLMKYRLRGDGFGPVIYVPLNPFWASIEEFSEILANTIKRVLVEGNHKKFYAVTHSIGGLVLKHSLIQDHFLRDRLACGIFLSTPHKLSPLARFVFGCSAKEMAPGIDVLEFTRRTFGVLGSANLWSIHSDIDWIVIGGSAVEPRMKDRNIYVPYVGHLSFLYSKRVYDSVNRLLSGRRFSAGVLLGP